MCDYSLHVVLSRPAELAEPIVTAEFFGTRTHGFASPSDPKVAVCLRPGTEIAFDRNVYARGVLFRKAIKDRLARFRQIDLDKPSQHHDALEFANGRIVLVTDLVIGQRARILQLPVAPAEKPVVAKPAGLMREAPELLPRRPRTCEFPMPRARNFLADGQLEGESHEK